MKKKSTELIGKILINVAVMVAEILNLFSEMKNDE